MTNVCAGFLKVTFAIIMSPDALVLDKDAPEAREIQANKLERIVQIRQVGGLHHRYQRRHSCPAVGLFRKIRLCFRRVAKRKNPEMHRRIAAFEAKRAGQILDSTKASSEQRHSSILFCLRPILLTTEYWLDKLTIPRIPQLCRRRIR
jgi:hypothetical protein